MKNLKNIALLVLLVVVALEYFYPNSKFGGKTMVVDGKKYEVIKEIHDTVDVEKIHTVYKQGKDIYHETIVHDTFTVASKIDTMSILRDYFAKNIYKDTLHLPDGLGVVFITDTVTKNQIAGRTFTANIRERVINNTTIVKELPKTQVFFGFDGGFNKTDVVSHIGTGLIIKTKGDKLYNLGLGVANRVSDGTNGRLTPFFNAGVYWKIKLKK